MELGKPKIHMQKNETGLLSNTIDKNIGSKNIKELNIRAAWKRFRSEGCFMNLAAKEKKEVFDGGSMADIFEYLLWDRWFVEVVSLNLPKIPVIV